MGSLNSCKSHALQYSMMLPSPLRQMTLMRLRVLSNSRMFRISYSTSTVPPEKMHRSCRLLKGTRLWLEALHSQ
jgi:hypothetical protein